MIEATAPQLLSEQCSTCIFRPGNPMHLREGRLADIARTNLRQGTALICHQTLAYGDHPEVGEAVCRGFYDAYKDECSVIQVVERLGGFKEDTGTMNAAAYALALYRAYTRNAAKALQQGRVADSEHFTNMANHYFKAYRSECRKGVRPFSIKRRMPT